MKNILNSVLFFTTVLCYFIIMAAVAVVMGILGNLLFVGLLSAQGIDLTHSATHTVELMFACLGILFWVSTSVRFWNKTTTRIFGPKPVTSAK